MFKFIEDLRIVVGSFFALLGIILVSVGYGDPVASTIDGTNMNLVAGWTMLVFSSAMLTWGFLGLKKAS
jgi:hypothetical protein